MTRAEFILKFKGYQTKKAREWEHTRQLCYAIEGTKRLKRKLPNIKSWWHLPTDPHTSVSEDKMKSTWELLKKNERNAKG